MSEKLFEYHNISISRETTRQWMIEAGVWRNKEKKSPVIHQQRKRRARFGELVQVDGSPHAWFEDRGDPCVLIVYIDDATGQILARFFKAETTNAYMLTSIDYIRKYGCPLAFYSDRHGIFRDNHNSTGQDALTQFGRAAKEMGIDLICANSPQAKGRVERANETFQDRLVKEMRIRGISNIEEGNKYLPEFLEQYNKRFAVRPEKDDDAHKKVSSETDLERIFCKKETRKVTKNLEIQYNNVIYQIIQEKPSRQLIRAIVTVLERPDGQISIEYRGKPLKFKEFAKQKFNGKEVTSKEIERFLKKKTVHKPSSNHPFKKKALLKKMMEEMYRTSCGIVK